MLRKPGVIVAELIRAQDFAGDARVYVAVRIGLGIGVRMGCEQDAEFHVALLPGWDRHLTSFRAASQEAFRRYSFSAASSPGSAGSFSAPVFRLPRRMRIIRTSKRM